MTSGQKILLSYTLVCVTAACDSADSTGWHTGKCAMVRS